MVVNALVLLRLDFFWQQVAAGVIIITSVAFYSSMQASPGGLSRRLQGLTWGRSRP